jgi:hypothetical protein
MQLGGMIYNEDPGVKTELIRVANQMRIHSEPMPEEYGHRILSSYNAINSRDELMETLSAVPPKDAWATFLWLDGKPAARSELEDQRLKREFIQANLLEIGGNRAEALAMFKTLQSELKSRGMNGRIASHVAGSISRLSRPPGC